MKSFKERYFHLVNDLAYIEVSDFSPRGKRVCSQACHHGWLKATATHPLAVLEARSPKPRCRQGRFPLEAGGRSRLGCF